MSALSRQGGGYRTGLRTGRRRLNQFNQAVSVSNGGSDEHGEFLFRIVPRVYREIDDTVRKRRRVGLAASVALYISQPLLPSMSYWEFFLLSV